ncbi:hypothetical protein NDU88_002882 [Pleurodeles waltl]|uniref:Uncharacterized protein n=1 Tax=Pleurodeles waltl TaxID=8319 RepID=A0AAV7UEB0_PLEWA|nr:hypothetical protein NDU88_002882 [Pleurodeles waltl]
MPESLRCEDHMKEEKPQFFERLTTDLVQTAISLEQRLKTCPLLGHRAPTGDPAAAGGTPLASPAALGPIALVPPRPAVPPAATNLVRRPAPVFILGRLLLGALPCHTPIRRGHSWALGPPPEPAPPRGDPSGVPRLSIPSAHTPLRASAQRKAAASAALSGLRAPSPTAGRFRPPALSVVAARVRALLATSSGPVPPLGPRQGRRGHDFKHFLAGPSGARSSGVRHLRVLGHAPHGEQCRAESTNEAISRAEPCTGYAQTQ